MHLTTLLLPIYFIVLIGTIIHAVTRPGIYPAFIGEKPTRVIWAVVLIFLASPVLLVIYWLVDFLLGREWRSGNNRGGKPRMIAPILAACILLVVILPTLPWSAMDSEIRATTPSDIPTGELWGIHLAKRSTTVHESLTTVSAGPATEEDEAPEGSWAPGVKTRILDIVVLEPDITSQMIAWEIGRQLLDHASVEEVRIRRLGMKSDPTPTADGIITISGKTNSGLFLSRAGHRSKGMHRIQYGIPTDTIVSLPNETYVGIDSGYEWNVHILGPHSTRNRLSTVANDLANRFMVSFQNSVLTKSVERSTADELALFDIYPAPRAAAPSFVVDVMGPVEMVSQHESVLATSRTWYQTRTAFTESEARELIANLNTVIESHKSIRSSIERPQDEDHRYGVTARFRKPPISPRVGIITRQSEIKAPIDVQVIEWREPEVLAELVRKRINPYDDQLGNLQGMLQFFPITMEVREEHSRIQRLIDSRRMIAEQFGSEDLSTIPIEDRERFSRSVLVLHSTQSSDDPEPGDPMLVAELLGLDLDLMFQMITESELEAEGWKLVEQGQDAEVRVAAGEPFRVAWYEIVEPFSASQPIVSSRSPHRMFWILLTPDENWKHNPNAIHFDGRFRYASGGGFRRNLILGSNHPTGHVIESPHGTQEAGFPFVRFTLVSEGDEWVYRMEPQSGQRHSGQ